MDCLQCLAVLLPFEVAAAVALTELFQTVLVIQVDLVVVVVGVFLTVLRAPERLDKDMPVAQGYLVRPVAAVAEVLEQLAQMASEHQGAMAEQVLLPL